jgi:iron complex transport system ATP-binding protein
VICAAGISVRLGGRAVLRDVSLRARVGEVLAIVGPNGAGKSTLLSVLAGELRPPTGAVTLDGRPLAAWSRLELARRRALLEQHSPLAAALRVEDVVLLGRAPHGTPSRDRELARQALDDVGLAALASRDYVRLSGGERQRVQLARVLAQLWDVDDALLLLDEPVSALDVGAQHHILTRARDRATRGAAVIVTLHDLNLTAQYADRVVLLDAGRVVAEGPPDRVLEPTTISDVYGWDMDLLPDRASGVSWIVPRTRRRREHSHAAP